MSDSTYKAYLYCRLVEKHYLLTSTIDNNFWNSCVFYNSLKIRQLRNNELLTLRGTDIFLFERMKLHLYRYLHDLISLKLHVLMVMEICFKTKMTKLLAIRTKLMTMMTKLMTLIAKLIAMMTKRRNHLIAKCGPIFSLNLNLFVMEIHFQSCQC